MCPVCRARFRGLTVCSRCGADLTMVMTLVASAWRLRQAARDALARGDFAQAAEIATQAQQLHSTPAGKALAGLSAWLPQHGAASPQAISNQLPPTVSGESVPQSGTTGF